ncbi:hypothetical protein Vadar_026566 [Vaccinium darrowii]|uniref:Uncharacterized protein n=1 Tax=Vaccinium darrowii TaxID=229202 RepID=A0ACB7Y9J6_9ERIC|nr:hypothetical protein Vadar_026566 [Vaccinium darrowii]
MANSATNVNTTTTTFVSYCFKAYKSASEKTPESLVFLCDFTRDNGPVSIDNRGDTVLHLLATNGNKIALERLLQAGLLSDDLLTSKNVHGNVALHEAAGFGHKEVAEIMLRRKPELVFVCNDTGETPLYLAAGYGKKEVFEVLEGYNSDCMMGRRDGRTILHAAIDGERYSFHFGEKGESVAALSQIFWDLHWFKRVKNDCYPHLWYVYNSNGKSAKELFEENHSALRRQAENACKILSSNGVVLTILIGTINFATLLTLPGGFDQNTGQPMLLKTNKQELQLFLVYVLLALHFAAVALAALLLVPLSRFDTNDFYVAIPLKLLVGSVTVVNCTGFTITAFSQGYILEAELGPFMANFLALLLVGGSLDLDWWPPLEHSSKVLNNHEEKLTKVERAHKAALRSHCTLYPQLGSSQEFIATTTMLSGISAAIVPKQRGKDQRDTRTSRHRGTRT